MDASTARWLVSPEAADALARAAAEADPDSLAAATRMRASLPPERAAAVLDQIALRRRARRKFADAADGFFWTALGLEQASRPAVSARRAARFAALGAEAGVDLGCGCGADAVALSRAGLRVTGVELDEVTAILAAANVAADDGSRVLTGDATELAPGLLGESVAVFCDPGRRSASGRSWRLADLSPSWEFVAGLLDGRRAACVKLGPGFPAALIPDTCEAEWISDAGDVVEAGLWAGPGVVPGRRRAVVGEHELVAEGRVDAPAVSAPKEFVYEPDGAVGASGLIPKLAWVLGAARLQEGVAYLTSDAFVRTPFATAFRVVEALPYSEKALRGWVRERRIGVLEIKKRGIEVDPASLRRKLRPSGPGKATLILTPTASGALALVVERV